MIQNLIFVYELKMYSLENLDIRFFSGLSRRCSGSLWRTCAEGGLGTGSPGKLPNRSTLHDDPRPCATVSQWLEHFRPQDAKASELVFLSRHHLLFRLHFCHNPGGDQRFVHLVCHPARGTVTHFRLAGDGRGFFSKIPSGKLMLNFGQPFCHALKIKYF